MSPAHTDMCQKVRPVDAWIEKMMECDKSKIAKC